MKEDPDIDNYLFHKALLDSENNSPLKEDQFDEFYKTCEDDGYKMKLDQFEKYLVYVKDILGEE